MSSAKRFGVFSTTFARHVAKKLATLTIGGVFVSDGAQRLRRKLAREAAAVKGVGPIAIVAHAYYPELLTEILKQRALLSGAVPLHVTVPHDKREQAEAIVAGSDHVHLHSVPNRGRDVAPFLSLLNAGELDRYDIVLKVHTKRSPHLLDGNIRRKLLFALLFGESNANRRVMNLFADPTVGVVGWGGCYHKNPAYWTDNKARALDLADRMGAGDVARLGFFEGTMFWVRPAALEPLRRLGLAVEDFEAEQGQTDGTLHHALERCFTIAAWSAGYDVLDLGGRVLDAGRPGGPASSGAIRSQPARSAGAVGQPR
ncbi:hypothetical protein DWF00_15525 [Bosea caraganae]|uniref:Rhamnan synthesis protein F n=1 Tax=Bosea caraganae TaxID=2763117 RepID=A0A370L6N1_9HYPH|nr:rhamnan synthesis F family protein [Bosea caraganae]RDJ25417.1 hypothetical protein DWE98_11860 [Bosea caraganae]RDJ25798.1 hypothetical protein DWF00_15525 [Bosea caraganae]